MEPVTQFGRFAVHARILVPERTSLRRRGLMPGGWASAGQRSGAGRWKERGQGAHARVSTSWPRLRAAAVVALGDRSDRTSHPVRSLCRARRDLVPEHALLASLALPAFRFCIWDLALDTEPVTQFGRFAAHAATWFPSTLCSPASPYPPSASVSGTSPWIQNRSPSSGALPRTPRPGSRARSARHLALPAFRFCTWNLVHIQKRSPSSGALPRTPDLAPRPEAATVRPLKTAPVVHPRRTALGIATGPDRVRFLQPSPQAHAGPPQQLPLRRSPRGSGPPAPSLARPVGSPGAGRSAFLASAPSRPLPRVFSRVTTCASDRDGMGLAALRRSGVHDPGLRSRRPHHLGVRLGRRDSARRGRLSSCRSQRGAAALRTNQGGGSAWASGSSPRHLSARSGAGVVGRVARTPPRGPQRRAPSSAARRLRDCRPPPGGLPRPGAPERDTCRDLEGSRMARSAHRPGSSYGPARRRE